MLPAAMASMSGSIVNRNRIIPRTHDGTTPKGDGLRMLRAGICASDAAHVFGARVTGGVPQHVVQRALDHAGFGHGAFCGALAEIALGAQRRSHLRR